MSVPKPGRANANATRFQSERAKWNKQQNSFRNAKGGKQTDVISRNPGKQQ